MIGFSALDLRWHDAATWQSLYAFESSAIGSGAANALMGLAILGGVGLVIPRVARHAAMLLVIVFGVFAIACLPAILAAPTHFDPYDGLFEQVAALSGAVALRFGYGAPSRIGFGACAAVFALAQVIYLASTAALVPAWIPPNGTTWAIATTIAFALAATAILADRRARAALGFTALMLGIFGALVWVPHIAMRPDAHLNWSEGALTLLILGGFVAGYGARRGTRRNGSSDPR
ncbi:MAG: hypothetical protein KGN02_02355 [bacterium]|nr:hypothetical protein [bacterium]